MLKSEIILIYQGIKGFKKKGGKKGKAFYFLFNNSRFH